jgi:eukaryotic-like serine/threonine-protein kinase
MKQTIDLDLLKTRVHQKFHKADRSSWSMTDCQAQGGVPAELQEEAARRLGVAGLIYSIGYFAAFYIAAVPRWIQSGEVPQHLLGWQVVVAIISILSGLFIFWISRCGKLSFCAVLEIGTVFFVLGAAGIAIPNAWGLIPVWDQEEFTRWRYGIPWESAWILIFAVVTNASPRKIALASLLAASAGPVTYILSRQAGASSSQTPLSVIVPFYLFSTYLCAGLSIFSSKVVEGLGHRITRAREIGQYQLHDLIGKGGMGEVWRGRHRLLAREAAIKLINPEMLGRNPGEADMALQRFEREAKATAALRSPNTIIIYDFGRNEDGAFYYVMELLEGLNLLEYVERFGPMSADRVIFIIRQACRSLHEAHLSGMIHRDIKPANMFLCRYGIETDFIKVLDFGLVRIKEEREESGAQLTERGIATGTPSFIAPEMILQKAGVDGRADLYALACVAYWLLTGDTVFDSDSGLEQIVMHAKEEPLPPSEKSELEIPAELDAIILRCLAKDPEARPLDAEALDRELAALEIAEQWSGEQAAEWWATHMPLADRDITGGKSVE